MPKKNLYFIAILPEGRVQEEIMALKQEVFEKFGSKSALKSPAHITLHMPFQWRADREEALKETMGRFTFLDFPFEVTLKNFDFFEPRVVFVDVVENALLISLKKQLTTFVKKELGVFNADYKDQGFHPHITIGFRDLKKSIFPQIKEYYSLRQFNAFFRAERICLLKQNGKSWDEWFYF